MSVLLLLSAGILELCLLLAHCLWDVLLHLLGHLGRLPLGISTCGELLLLLGYKNLLHLLEVSWVTQEGLRSGIQAGGRCGATCLLVLLGGRQ